MAAKYALIVDDSRIAQVKLRRMLARYEQLEVDCVASAEEALSYLSRKRPAVVFMDHLMKGMDGFEALRVIKSNPDTATVPVIMYTSKSGDLYVSQARALGAIDVISKDVIEISSLDKVLEAVKIYPTREATRAFAAVSIPAEPAAPAPEPTAEVEQQKAPGLDLRGQIARMLDIHIVRIVQEIGDGNRLMAKRLFRELQELKDKQTSAPATTVAKPLLQIEPPRTRNSYTWIAVVVLCLVLLLVFQQLHRSNQQQLSMSEHYARLNDFIETQYGNVARDNKKLSKKLVLDQNLSLKPEPLYEALAWSINRENLFRFGELALNERQLDILSRLVHYLTLANFSGTVSIKIYFGDFCVVADQSGQFKLPDPASALGSCHFLGERLSDSSLESQQVWAFSNYLLNTAEIQSGRIRVQIQSYGDEDPMSEYPPQSAGTTAGEWNHVAQINNRIVYTINPDN